MSEHRATRVVCFGDSITHHGYPRVLGELLGVEAINAGVGGHTSADGLKRLQRDVLDHRPDLVVILFGTNDARLDAPGVCVAPEQYERNLETMVRACRSIGAQVVIGTIPPIDAGPYFTRHVLEPFERGGGLEAVLERYRAAVRRLAAAHAIPLVDLARTLAARPQWLSADGVHPAGETGAQILAEEIAVVVQPILEGRGRTSPDPSAG